MSITDTQLDDLHERIDALGGRATDEYDRGANDAIRDALRVVESFGGMGPQDRKLKAHIVDPQVWELSDRNEILESQLKVQTIRRERAEREVAALRFQRDALSARLTRDGVPDSVTVTTLGERG